MQNLNLLKAASIGIILSSAMFINAAEVSKATQRIGHHHIGART